jgi:hypothetical protein
MISACCSLFACYHASGRCWTRAGCLRADAWLSGVAPVRQCMLCRGWSVCRRCRMAAAGCACTAAWHGVVPGLGACARCCRASGAKMCCCARCHMSWRACCARAGHLRAAAWLLRGVHIQPRGMVSRQGWARVRAAAGLLGPTCAAVHAAMCTIVHAAPGLAICVLQQGIAGGVCKPQAQSQDIPGPFQGEGAYAAAGTPWVYVPGHRVLSSTPKPLEDCRLAAGQRGAHLHKGRTCFSVVAECVRISVRGRCVYAATGTVG